MIRIFVGCAPNHEDAESQAVLEYTLRKHGSIPVEITWMKLSHDKSSPFYGWESSSWATPFSAFRWAVPSLCNFSGKAIYMDSDIIVMQDIAKLWNHEFEPGKIAMAKAAGGWRYCVSLWDCAAAQSFLPEIGWIKSNADAHRTLCDKLANNSQLLQELPGNWNCLDGEEYKTLDDPAICALHYTSRQHQPHLRYAIPRLEAQGRQHWYHGRVEQHWRPDLISLFDRLLLEASEAGFPVSRYENDPIFGVSDNDRSRHLHKITPELTSC